MPQETIETARRLRLYETILSTTPDLVYVFDGRHRLTYANDVLLAAWRLSSSEALGKTLADLGCTTVHNHEIDRAIARRRPVHGVGRFAGAPTERVYDYVFVPVFDETGELESIAGTARDITDAHRAEAELRRADGQKEEFIALLAHEIRNPLSPIVSALEAMKVAADDRSQVAEALGILERQVAQLRRLTDDLLDVSRITRKKFKLQRSSVALEDIVAHAVEIVRPAIAAKRQTLDVSLPPDPVYLDADSMRLSQVFSNLLENSMRYTQEGGRIGLAAQRVGDRVHVAVVDDGVGISEVKMPLIFEMFAQASRDSAPDDQGLGVGLALVKCVVELHGGAVAAESAGIGHGSRFVVALPISVASPGGGTDRDGSRGDQIEASASKRRVLLIDDNEDGVASLGHMLELMGNDVLIAYNAADGLRLAERYRPYIVFMDIGMPEVDGLTATRQLRATEWGKSMFVYALTGWGYEKDRIESRRAGCDGHLVKPVAANELRRLIGGLGQRQSSLPRDG